MSSRFRKTSAFLSLFLVLASTAYWVICSTPNYFWIPAVIFSIPSALGAIIGERLQRANAKLFFVSKKRLNIWLRLPNVNASRVIYMIWTGILIGDTLKAELARKLHDRDGGRVERDRRYRTNCASSSG